MDAASAELLAHDAEARRFRNALIVSGAAHAAAFVVFLLAPTPRPAPLLPIVSVELVAPAAAPARLRPAPAAAKRPAKAPTPVPPAPPRPAKTVLPKDPKPLAAKPRPRKAAPRERPQELGYEDALASLRAELGEEAGASPIAAARSAANEKNAAQSAATIDRELANWVLATRAHVRRAWVMPPDFLNRGLRVDLRVTLMADGTVLGPPEIVASSGDPYFDENTVRAVQRASPLPAPPEAGDWPFRFEPEEGRGGGG